MDVKKFYEEIGGSYSNAISIMMNDALIARMLSKFMVSNACEQIVTSYENKDFRAVFASSHSFKGVAGNLALTPLFELASTITEATRNSDDVNLDKEIGELKKAYALIEEKYAQYIA